MFKINSYSLFLLTTLCLNSSTVRGSSSNTNNDSINTHKTSLFPNIYNPLEGSNTITPFFPPNSSITPQPCLFNNSTNTFISPFMLSGWRNNMSTDTFADFNINNTSLPIMHKIENFNDPFANANNGNLLFMPNDPISSSTPDIALNRNENTVRLIVHEPEQQQVSYTKRNNYHMLSKNKKKKPTKTYTCPTCHKSLGSQNGFNYHLKTHDPNRPKPHQCHICHKSFAKKSTLKSHILTHTSEKPFKCDLCSKSFKTKSEKIGHYRAHTDENPFKCNICQRKLSSKVALENHLNKHKNKKPHKCNQCTKSYVTKNGLKYHLKTHSNPYTCHYCGAAFAYKSKYEDHIRYEEETDEDRKCHICKKTYISNYNLRQHNKRAHPRLK